MSEDKIRIHVENLRKHFGDLEVLKSISMDVREGEVVVVIGPSGSGKSTFLRCLNRLEEATGGTIEIDGTNIGARGVNMNKVRENIGMVFQHFNLFPHMTVLRNMTIAPIKLLKKSPETAEKEAKALLERVNLSDIESRMYFDSSLRSAGIFDRLEDLGVQEGDTISLYDLEFEYRR